MTDSVPYINYHLNTQFVLLGGDLALLGSYKAKEQGYEYAALRNTRALHYGLMGYKEGQRNNE